MATGDFVWIAESDDLAEPNFIETLMYGFLDNNDVVLAYSGVRVVDASMKTIGLINDGGNRELLEGKKFIRRRLYYDNSIFNCSSVIFKKSAIMNVPTNYTSYRGCGDWLLYIEVIKQGFVYKVDECLDICRRLNTSATATNIRSGRVFEEHYKIFSRLCELRYLNGFRKQVVIGRNLMILRQLLNDPHLDKDYRDRIQNIYDYWKQECVIAYMPILCNRLLFKYYGVKKRIKKYCQCNTSKNQ